MENKDFRDRLKEYEVPVNNGAWDMMNAMLESSQEPPRKKKRNRKFFFWIWFVGLGLIISALYKYSIDNQVKSISQNSVQVTDVPLANTKNPALDKDLTKENKLVNINDVDYQSQNTSDKNNKILNKNLGPDKTISIFIDTDRSNYNNEISVPTNGHINESAEAFKNESQSVTKADSKSTLDKGLSFDSKLNPSFNENSNNIQKSKNLSTASFDKNTNEPIVSKSKELDGTKEIKKEDHRSLTKLQIEKLLTLDNLNFLKTEPRPINITLAKQQKLYAYGQIGYASFNNNPGFNLGGGLLYELDKLLYFESLLSYSYGKESGVTRGELATSEYEIDLGIIINLNLINTRKNRIAFELGSGVTKYWGNRIIRSEPITIDSRNSFGTHFQGGISYHYSLDKNTRVSLKFGVVSYDDAVTYLAFKFYKKL